MSDGIKRMHEDEEDEQRRKDMEFWRHAEPEFIIAMMKVLRDELHRLSLDDSITVRTNRSIVRMREAVVKFHERTKALQS